MDKWVMFIMAMVAVLIVGGFFGFTTLNELNVDKDETIEIADNAVPYGVATDKTTLAITVDGSGTVGTIPYQKNYKAGEQVKLTALALDGWTFDHWQGKASGEQDSFIITLVEGENQVNAVLKKSNE